MACRQSRYRRPRATEPSGDRPRAAALNGGFWAARGVPSSAGMVDLVARDFDRNPFRKQRFALVESDFKDAVFMGRGDRVSLDVGRELD